MALSLPLPLLLLPLPLLSILDMEDIAKYPLILLLNCSVLRGERGEERGGMIVFVLLHGGQGEGTSSIVGGRTGGKIRHRSNGQETQQQQALPTLSLPVYILYQSPSYSLILLFYDIIRDIEP